MSAQGGFAPRTPVCPSCGVVAPSHGTTCESCGRPLGNPRTFAPLTGNVSWGAIRASFACRSCGFPSPLDGVVTDDGIACAQCGSFQRFEPSAWVAALSFAHAVADLGGPSPEGRAPNAEVWIGKGNPHASIGLTKTFASHDSSLLEIETCPGFPVCTRCSTLLDVRPEGDAAVTRCPSCQATARYVLSPKAAALGTTARAIVAEEQRTDRRDVNVQASEAGLVALTCPQCGAAVRASGGQTVECTYCRTVAFVPPRARPRGTGGVVRPIVFWVAFEGPSPERVALEAPKPAAITGTAATKRVKGIFARGLSPLAGIDLADRKPGIDVKQWLITIGLTAFAMAVGYAIFVATSG